MVFPKLKKTAYDYRLECYFCKCHLQNSKQSKLASGTCQIEKEDEVVNGIDYMSYQTCSSYEQKILATLSQTFSNCDNRIVTNTNDIVE